MPRRASRARTTAARPPGCRDRCKTAPRRRRCESSPYTLGLRVRAGVLPGGREARKRLQERIAVILELLVTDAVDGAQLGLGAWQVARHRAQGRIGKDDVRGDVASVRNLFAQRAQLFEQRVVEGAVVSRGPRAGTGR